MEQKHSKSEFNVEEFESIKEQLKKAYTEAKKEQKKENPKQSLSQKIIGIIILVIIIVGVGTVLLFNLDMLLLPKNSVTITVKDQYGNVIDGLKLQVQSSDSIFYIEYDKDSTSEITQLGVKPGDYSLNFINIPEGYTCLKVVDKFIFKENDKIKVEYICTKDFK